MVQTKISGYIFGVLAFVLIISTCTFMMAEFRKADPNYASDPRFSRFNDTFNQYAEVEDEIDTLKAGVEGVDSSQFGAFGVLNALISGAWRSLVAALSSFAFMNVVFEGLGQEFGVPVFVSGIIIMAVGLIFVFAIFSAIFQREL